MPRAALALAALLLTVGCASQRSTPVVSNDDQPAYATEFHSDASPISHRNDPYFKMYVDPTPTSPN